MRMKYILILFVLEFTIYFVYALNVNIPLPTNTTSTFNNNTANVNNSQYLQGYTPFNLPYLVSESDPLYNAQSGNICYKNGTNAYTYNSSYAEYQFSSNNFNGSGNFNTSGNIQASSIYMTKNASATGSFSAQFGYDPAVIAIGNPSTVGAFQGGYYSAGGSSSSIYFGQNYYFRTGAWVIPSSAQKTAMMLLQGGKFYVQASDTANVAPTQVFIVTRQNVTFGGAVANVDYAMLFDGETNDGILRFMEDEKEFRFDSNINISNANITNINRLCNSTGSCFTLTELNTSSGGGGNSSWNETLANSLYKYFNLTNGNKTLAPINRTRGFEVGGGIANQTGAFAISGGKAYGEYSFAGYNSIASGTGAFAYGSSLAYGGDSFAVSGGISTGQYGFSTSGGYASGYFSEANTGATASEYYSYASGLSQVSGQYGVGFIDAINPFEKYFMIGGSTGVTDDNTKIPLQVDAVTPAVKFFVSSPDVVFGCAGTLTACTDLLADPPCSSVSGCAWGDVYACDNPDPSCQASEGVCIDCIDTSYCSGEGDCPIYDQGTCEGDPTCTWNPVQEGCCGTWAYQSTSCSGEILNTDCNQISYANCDNTNTNTLCTSTIANDIITHIDRAGVGQSLDIYQARDATDAVVAKIDPTGKLTCTDYLYLNSANGNGQVFVDDGTTAQAGSITLKNSAGKSLSIRPDGTVLAYIASYNKSHTFYAQGDGGIDIIGTAGSSTNPTTRLKLGVGRGAGAKPNNFTYILSTYANTYYGVPEQSWNMLLAGFNFTRGINITINYTDTNIIGNTTFSNLIKLDVVTLPACSASVNGSIGRNNTGLYYCNNTAIWSRLG